MTDRINFTEISAKLEAERKMDAENIMAHANASREKIEALGIDEDNFVRYVEDARKMTIEAFDNMIAGFHSLFSEMREKEKQRLASLEAQAGSMVVETQQPAKRLRAVD